MSPDILPYGKHQIDEDDIAAVADVLRGGALTCGPKVAEFEEAFARKIGAKEAVVCANGTAALHLACMAAGLGPGDIAIVPAITFLATANAVLMTGADVVFADVCPKTGLMTSETFEDAIRKAGNKVSAVLPVHMNGQAGDIAAIYARAKQHKMQVITDCCHALGAEYFSGGRPGDGQFEDLATFSLHPVKSIAMGEGGFIATNSPKFASKMRMLRGHAMEKRPDSWLNTEMAFDDDQTANPWYYEMQMLAYNYRANDIQCALGLSQLEKLDAFINRRREIADLYDQKLAKISNNIKAIDRAGVTNSAWHLYPVLIDFDILGVSRAEAMKKLFEKGVGTQVHYVPVSKQPYYEQRYGPQNLPGADAYYESVLSLPIFPAMSEDDVDKVVDALTSL